MLYNSLSPLSEKEPPVQYPWLAQNECCETAVIGGTVTGCAAAAALSKNTADTVLLCAEPVGNESAAALPAMLQTGALLLSTLIKKTDMETAVAAFRDFRLAADEAEKAAVEHSLPFAGRDVLLCSADEKDASLLEEEYRLRRHNGMDAVLFGADELREQYAFPAKTGVLIPNGSLSIDPIRLSRYLAAQAAEHGARVYEQTDVLSIEQNGNGYEIETATGRHIRAKQVVLARQTGFEEVSGIKGRKRVFASSSAPCSDFSGYESRAAVFFTDRSLALCTAEDDRVTAFSSGYSLFPHAPQHSYRFERLEDRCRSLLCGTRPVFPERRASMRYYATRTGLPVIGEAPDISGLFLICNASPDEMTTALLAAPVIAGLCAGKHPFNPYAPAQ